MNSLAHSQLLAALHSRQDLIADHWYRAISRTSYVRFDPTQIQQYLVDWTGELSDLLSIEPFEYARAEAVGAALAGLHYLQPEALGRTLNVLSVQLLQGLSPEQAVALQPNLAALLSGLASGFYRQASEIILAEQEGIRKALVTELSHTTEALRQARDSLELRVEQRTAELAQANENLRSEIAEHESARRALRKSENKYRTLLETVPDGVYTLDSEGRITFVNDVIVERSGMRPEEILNRKYYELLRPEDRDRVRQIFEAVMSGEPMPVYELVIPTASGSTFWVEVNATALWEDGQIVGLHAVSRDISERKKLDEMKDNLIRDVSHELRTPLAKMKMGIELLAEALAKETLDRQRVTRIAEMAQSNVNRLLRIAEGILDLSSLEAGRTMFNMDELWPEDLITSVLQEMKPLASDAGLVLRACVPDDLSTVRGDWEGLFRVLTNLVDNAIKFTEQGEIVVCAEKRPGELRISVIDSGFGVVPENLERIFERFFQEKTRFYGVGVGLAICRAIVEAHGGRIWAESAGRELGTTVRFTLPLEER
jgi:PAS domain S-box-containing protein